ncbi:conserved hypothetical protein [Burkholderia sp. 8Y]|uniref:hypothetical protein n=1 Tax=Burkholderia sp. 8Y TaxID=2653133 RepID=UPI0012F018CB|nr:hypothetical protein [Burkholderia sp. 8Y]VXC83068.1 conserved hypothetical protein [Burkholderia sp. 8Y]
MPIKMSSHVSGDMRLQAEMLTFLVISHLATKFATGDWMSIESIVESCAYWSKAMQRDEDVIARVMLASRARPIAAATGQTLNGSALASIFDSNLRLDFSSAKTRAIFDRCLQSLLTSKRLANSP